MSEDKDAGSQRDDGQQTGQVGARLRSTRLERGMSLAEVATRAGLSRGFLSRVERGLVSASLGSLLRWTKALDVTVASVFEFNPDITNQRVRSPAFAVKGVIDYLLTSRDEKRFEVFEEHLDPGRDPDPRYWSVDAEYAFVFVIRGALEIEFNHGQRKVKLQAGDLHVYAPREPHRWTNTSRESTVLLIFDSPANRF